MLPDGRRIGAHLPLGSGMVKAVERTAATGGSALQVFSDNPTSWRRRLEPPREAPAFRARLSELGIAVVSIHAAYLVNLASPEDEVHRRSIELLASELRVAPDFGARLVNVHIGSHRGSGLEAGVSRVAEGIRLALADVDHAGLPGAGPSAPVLVLENSAGSGHGVGVTVDELARIADAAAAAGVPDGALAFCLDTAHAWGAGARLAEPDEVDALLSEFDRRIGLGRIALVHLNDSRVEAGSRLDRHEHIGAGQIGSRGLARMLTHPGLADAAYILETPGMDEGFDQVNLARAAALARNETLDSLPEEAFAVRGARSRTPPSA